MQRRANKAPEPTPVFGDDYFLPAGWIGETHVDPEKIEQCAPDDELHIEAWDQS
jgi:hypothetical protein